MKNPLPQMSRYLIIPLVLALLGQVKALAVVEIYNTVTNFNWVCPVGVTNLQVECWGGGGAGGGSWVNGGSANAGGGGGGGGAYAKMILVPVTAGNSYNITIPAAAASPASGFINAQTYDGSNVSFTGDNLVVVSANGGKGGGCAVVTSSSAISGAAGAGGAAGVGLDAAWKGGNAVFWSAGNGGGGGGGAGDLGAGGNSSVANATFGAGGTGSDADHTGGDGGASRNGAGTGNSASNPGGGGGGAKSTTTSTTSRAGGKGGLGQIILTYTANVPAALVVVKTNNFDNLNLGTSWVGGVAPTATGVAKWDNTVTSANTTVLGADVTWQGIIIADPIGLVTINASNTLTLGGASTNIDLSSATADLTLNCALALGSGNVWDVAAGRTLTLGGAVSGSQALTKQGDGTAIFSVANTYSGNTAINGGTLQLGASNVMPDGSGKGDVTVNGALDLNTFSETINGLNGTGTVDTLAGGTPTLTVGANDAAGTFSGNIINTAGTLSLIKTGTGRQVLSGTNTFSGSVAINQGSLAVGADSVAGPAYDPLANVAGLTLANGTTFGAYGQYVSIAEPITLSGGTVTITPVSAAVNPGGTTARPFTLSGGITGNGDVIFKGVNLYNAYGTISVGSSSYTGNTLITCDNSLQSIWPVPNTNNNEIIVQLRVNNALPTTTVLTMDGDVGVGSGRFCDLNLNGKDQQLAGLTNIPRNLRNQRVINPSGSAAATLTISNNVDYEFSGQLGGNGGSLGASTATGNNFSLVKSGSGTLYLSRSAGNTYANDTTVNGGTLRIRTASFATNSTVSVAAGAVLQLDFAGTAVVAGFVTNGVSLAPGIYSSNTVAPFIAGSGSLQIPGAGPSGPGSITNSVSGNTLTLTWPAGQTWRLVGQTNNSSTGLNPSPSAWFDVPGGVDGSNSITIDPGNPSVFYKLVSP